MLRNINLKKNTKTLSCASHFTSTLYVVFKINNITQFTNIPQDIASSNSINIKGNMEGSHNE